MASGSLEALMFAHDLLRCLWWVLCDPRMMLVKSWLEKVDNLINRQEQVKQVAAKINAAVRRINMLILLSFMEIKRCYDNAVTPLAASG